MITTRYGSRVEILGVDFSGQWVRVRRIEDGALREWRVVDLCADTVSELEEALTSAPVYGSQTQAVRS